MTSEMMVRAFGMGMNVLDLLVKEVKAQGGREEAIRLITLPRFKHNLEAVGRIIAQADWRIPASVMRDLAPKKCGCRLTTKHMRETARNLWWIFACIDFGIPYRSFSEDRDHGDPAIPSMILRKLKDRRMEYPFFLDERYVVVNLDMKEGLCPKPGDFIHVSNIDSIAIAERHHFDFDT